MNITITQDNSRVEILGSNGSAIIDKLYQLAIDPNNTLTLTGNISTNSAYGYQVDYLNTNYGPDFIVSATNRYIRFQDSVVQSVLTAQIGDGIGVTEQTVRTINTIGTIFRNNTNITSFSDLNLFTNVTAIENNAFQGCTNLTQINLSNVATIGTTAFQSCSNLTSVSFGSGLTSMSSGVFQSCSNLTSVDFQNCTNLATIGDNMFSSCSNITSIDLSNTKITTIPYRIIFHCFQLNTIKLPDTITQIADGGLTTESNTEKSIILLSTTPPTLATNNAFGGTDGNGNYHFTIYVPDSSLSAYQNAGGYWSTFTSLLRPLSDYTNS